MLEMDCMPPNLEIETKAIPHEAGYHRRGEDPSPLVMLQMLLKLCPSYFCTGRTATFKGL